MSKGVLVVLALTGYFTVAGLALPYLGLAGYFGFVTLCPQWHWRGLLPDLDYQKMIAGATLLGFLANGLRGNQLRGPLWHATLGMLAYLVFSLVSCLQSVAPVESWWYMAYFWKIALMSLVGFVLLDEPRKLMTCMWVVLLAQSYNALRVNQIYFEQGFIDVISFEWNYMTSNQFSIQSIPTLALAAALTLHAEKTWQRVLAGALALLQVHQLMLLESRGSMLGAVIMFGLGCFFMPRTRWNMTGLVSAVLVVGALAGPPVVKEFMSSFRGGQELDASARSRTELWRAGILITRDYPMLGAGPFAGDSLVPKYHRQQIRFTRRALHNLLLELSTGSGIPATIGFVVFFAAIWWGHVRLWASVGLGQLPEWAQTVSLATLAGIPGYWLANMFSSGSLIETGYCCAMFGGAGLTLIYRELDERQQAWWEQQAAWEWALAQGQYPELPAAAGYA